MIGFILKKIVGSKNDREVKKLRPLVAQINEIEAGLQKLSDDELRQKTADWKARLSAIQDKTELAAALMEVLPEAYAVVKTACRRLCGQRRDDEARARSRFEEAPHGDSRSQGRLASACAG